jgi:hypothetical protein
MLFIKAIYVAQKRWIDKLEKIRNKEGAGRGDNNMEQHSIGTESVVVVGEGESNRTRG